jgi:hypothetical protein
VGFHYEEIGFLMTRRFIISLIAVTIYLGMIEAVPAQEYGSPTVSAVDELLESALVSAENGEWQKALEILDQAESLQPSDPRIASYRSSILELAALDEAQDSWKEGRPADVKDPSHETQDPENDEPKFVIDRGDRDESNNPVRFRDRFRGEVDVKILAVDPLESESLNTWSSSNEFFYASLGADLSYWLPYLGRSFGVNFRSSGYSWPPGNPDLLFNSVDLGLNARGFILESVTSRMEIGIDVGAALHSIDDAELSLERTSAFYLGLWLSDPILFHLLNAESLEDIVFGGGIRIYSSTAEELLETIHYRLDGSWRFDGGYAGVRLGWWDFSAEAQRWTMLSISLFGGYRF